MAEEEATDRNKTRLLLLGTGNTGKSTFFRQFQIQYCGGIAEDAKRLFRRMIKDQCVFYMRQLGRLCMQRHENDDNFTLGDDIHNLLVEHWSWDVADQPPLTLEIGEQIELLWNSPAVRTVFEHHAASHGRYIPVSFEYFWDDIARFAQPDFEPNDEDCIKAYSRTSGIVSLEYVHRGVIFELYDIGGQRSERRKWIHVFDGVNVLLYVISLSAYDEMLFDDRSMNAMTEQVEVFAETVNLPCFVDMNVIIFLNKSDLLQRKLDSGQSISSYFPGYQGDRSFESSVLYIQEHLESLNQSTSERLFIFHVTCATDTKNSKRVLKGVTQTIVSKSLRDVGL